MNVNRFIRNTETRRFLRTDGVWLQSRHGATDFPSLTAAHKYCTEHRLTDVEIVLIENNGVTLVPIGN
jgi:hypothetical protein